MKGFNKEGTIVVGAIYLRFDRRSTSSRSPWAYVQVEADGQYDHLCGLNEAFGHNWATQVSDEQLWQLAAWLGKAEDLAVDVVRRAQVEADARRVIEKREELARLEAKLADLKSKLP